MLLALSLWLFALGSLLFCLSLIAYHLLLIAYCFPKNLSSRASRAAASRGTTHLHLLFLSRNSKPETRNLFFNHPMTRSLNHPIATAPPSNSPVPRSRAQSQSCRAPPPHPSSCACSCST